MLIPSNWSWSPTWIGTLITSRGLLNQHKNVKKNIHCNLPQVYSLFFFLISTSLFSFYEWSISFLLFFFKVKTHAPKWVRTHNPSSHVQAFTCQVIPIRKQLYKWNKGSFILKYGDFELSTKMRLIS